MENCERDCVVEDDHDVCLTEFDLIEDQVAARDYREPVR